MNNNILNMCNYVMVNLKLLYVAIARNNFVQYVEN
jgi:hypothetical protein